MNIVQETKLASKRGKNKKNSFVDKVFAASSLKL